jgi:hypothetical protein
MSIQAMGEKIKGFWEKEGRDILLIAIVVLTGVGGYCIGIYSKNPENTGNTGSLVLIQIAPGTNLENYSISSSVKNVGNQLSASTNTSGGFVASKNGTKYYPVGCGSVSRINEENKIYFDSPTEAENAGYTRTTACK